ncbi:MAG: hypothetical protein NC483_00590 [Ruminococcus sp.]|nr:hypothetical protein [Ruminococcus sp.]
MNILNSGRNIYVEKILNKYKANIYTDVIVLYGPVKVTEFMLLKRFIEINNLDIKVLVRYKSIS